MRKYVLFMIACAVIMSLAACGKAPEKGSVKQENISVFPKQEKGYVGDPMPYFDGEKMNVFYLHDARRAGPFHPWYLFQTEDFCLWSDKGVAINWENDVESPDYALGTGSVIRDGNGLYHAFYTGWNNSVHVEYTEKIQHAVSEDLLNWTKIPEDGFYGGQNDFRDPYVFYSEDDGCYYMLITSMQGGGVIRQYKSDDLKSWTDDGIFFHNDAGSYNMECPTFLHYNGWWYLSFSEQSADGSPERVFRYRYKKNESDDWIKPEKDYIDGAGFYAGRMEKYHERLLVFGWVPTKEHDYDMGIFNWAGNLVTHELKQKENGELYAVAVSEAAEKLATEVSYKTTAKTAVYKKGSISFGGEDEYILFESLEAKPTKHEFTIIPPETRGTVKLLFGADGGSTDGAFSVDINFDSMRLEFYTPGKDGEKLQAYSEFSEKEAYDCILLTENECLTLYIEGETAFTTRIYAMPGAEFGIASDCAAKINNLKFFE